MKIRRLLPSPALALALLWIAPGCKHGSLDVAIKETLPPEYQPRMPVNSRPNLGRRLVPGTNHAEINACYVGVLAKPDPSWNNVTVKYKRATRASVGADFGDLVALTGDVEASVSGAVTLRGTTIFELKSLSFLPASGCAEGPERAAYRQGKRERVVAVAIWARELDAQKTQSSKVGLAPKVKILPSNIDVNAAITTSNDVETKLDGAGLFYAERIDEVTTTLTDFEETIAIGQATRKYDACRFFLAGFGDDPGGAGNQRKWSGRLICDGAAVQEMAGEVNGTVAAASLGAGVSYSVFVADPDEAALGRAKVQLSRWVVAQPR